MNTEKCGYWPGTRIYDRERKVFVTYGDEPWLIYLDIEYHPPIDYIGITKDIVDSNR